MRERIGLAFLGTGEYDPARYTWNDRSKRSRFVQVAIQELFDLDRFMVAMTDEARQKNGAALNDKIAAEPLQILKGTNEEEWWDVFQTIVDAIPHDARLTIDVTHGFRSQPLVVLAVVIYLQAARDVEVDHILYGLFRGEEQDAPILDLTPFLTLIEWSIAARQFLRDGSAAQLAQLLRHAQNEAYRTSASVKPQHAKSAGRQLEKLTEALAVVRPQRIIEERAGALVDQLDALREDVSRVKELRPLSVLLKQVRDRVAPMQAATLFSPNGFAAQIEMMRFYLQTNQLQQAITLAREALVSHEALRRGLSPEPVPRHEWDGCGRHRAETELGRLADTNDEARTAEEKERGDLWSGLTEVRNDINHAGMNAQPRSGRKLAARAQGVVEDVVTYLQAHPL